MASEGFDVNAYNSPFMLTKSLQRDVYPIVDPTQNSDLRADSKVVLITGGAGGLGFATAKAWIAARDNSVVLVGRTQETLERAVHDLNSKSNVLAIKSLSTIPTTNSIPFHSAQVSSILEYLRKTISHLSKSQKKPSQSSDLHLSQKTHFRDLCWVW